MARIWSSGFELNSTTANVEFDSTSNITISSSIVRSGTYAGRATATAAQATLRQILFTTTQSTIGYIRVYFRIESSGTAAVRSLFFEDTANAIQAGIRLNTDDTLTLIKANGGTLGSNSSALKHNYWYLLELKNDATGAGAIEARLEGTVFASGANSSQGKWARVSMGGFANNSTFDLYFDDIAVNDSTGSFQNTYPGHGKIIHLKPSAAGDANGFLVQIGGTAGSANNFTRVNEVTPDDATSYNGSAVLSAEDLFNADDSGISSLDIVNVVSVGGRFADLVGADATAAFKLEIEKTAVGTKSQSATIIPNSTTWRTNASATPWLYPITLYQDPDGTAWNQTTLDSMQIGYTQTATNVQTIAVSKVWTLVDYTPNGANRFFGLF